jgi:hypothetical protein
MNTTIPSVRTPETEPKGAVRPTTNPVVPELDKKQNLKAA